MKRKTAKEKVALALGPDPKFCGNTRELCKLLRREVISLRRWIGRREAELTRARIELSVTRARFNELGFQTGPLYARLEKLIKDRENGN